MFDLVMTLHSPFRLWFSKIMVCTFSVSDGLPPVDVMEPPYGVYPSNTTPKKQEVKAKVSYSYYGNTFFQSSACLIIW